MLGVVLRSDLSWGANTEYMVKRANRKLWCLRRLKKLGARRSDLIDVYIKQIRSLLEFAVAVWHPSLTYEDRLKIECVQKSALCIIMVLQYKSYRSALKEMQLESLYSRRNKLCKIFASKSLKHTKFSKWFKPTNKRTFIRFKPTRFCEVYARTNRFKKSPISYLTYILNTK